MSNKELTNGELAKAIALIKGWQGSLSISRVGSIEMCLGGHHGCLGLSILLGLRDEYEVEIDYSAKEVCIWGTKEGQNAIALTSVEFADKTQINRAAMLCILESVK